MSIYKKASRIKGLRIPKDRGELTVEQAWRTSNTTLVNALTNLNEQIQKTNSTGLDFLNETQEVDEILPGDQLASLEDKPRY